MTISLCVCVSMCDYLSACEWPGQLQLAIVAMPCVVIFYQPAGISSLCISVWPCGYLAWRIVIWQYQLQQWPMWLLYRANINGNIWRINILYSSWLASQPLIHSAGQCVSWHQLWPSVASQPSSILASSQLQLSSLASPACGLVWPSQWQPNISQQGYLCGPICGYCCIITTMTANIVLWLICAYCGRNDDNENIVIININGNQHVAKYCVILLASHYCGQWLAAMCGMQWYCDVAIIGNQLTVMAISLWRMCEEPGLPSIIWPIQPID